MASPRFCDTCRRAYRRGGSCGWPRRLHRPRRSPSGSSGCRGRPAHNPSAGGPGRRPSRHPKRSPRPHSNRPPGTPLRAVHGVDRRAPIHRLDSVENTVTRIFHSASTVRGYLAQRSTRQYRLQLGVVFLLGLISVLALANLLFGAVTLSAERVWFATVGQGDSAIGDPVAEEIIWNLRLPRLLVGALIGVHFAIAGSLLQAVLRNPLADSGVIGINAGAGLAAVLAFAVAERLAGDANPYLRAALSLDWLPLIACGGGIVAAAVVYRLSWNGGSTPVRLVLMGIAVAGLLSALTTGILAGWAQASTETALAWLSGSLYGRDWAHLSTLLPWTIAGLFLLPLLLRGANLLQLGDEVAATRGLRVERSRFALLLVAVLFAASAVGIVGPVGFVGLIVAHIARLMVGPDIKHQLIVSPLLGALLVLAADLIGRLVLVPAELPIGVVTSLLGVPFFLALLARRR
ncbi:iron chelate uptake ABC transporter family permease subunit [Guyparkeria halophila]|uniref:Iron chelate uptake ABC transporter family permease subunit n=1 Tax=Guyparkeria halophila TaxID=47960 RepID=A0A6I6D610_9GAMM|nr:iron chelate uptake ABC transporter family permease subunit [Guyparkeria halophila]